MCRAQRDKTETFCCALEGSGLCAETTKPIMLHTIGPLAAGACLLIHVEDKDSAVTQIMEGFRALRTRAAIDHKCLPGEAVFAGSSETLRALIEFVQ
jgi:hypothetical protein